MRIVFIRCRAASWLLLSAMTCGLGDSTVAAQRRPVNVSVPMTLHTPEPEQFSLALDEIELDWSENDLKRTASGPPFAVSSTRLTLVEPTRAVFAVTGVTTPEGLTAMGFALEGSNPGAEANFVLYEPGGRNPSSRRVLTTHTALLLEDPTDPQDVLKDYPQTVTPVEGVPGGYVLEAFDPLSAVRLAETLRNRAGIKSAYPLVKRRHSIR